VPQRAPYLSSYGVKASSLFDGTALAGTIFANRAPSCRVTFRPRDEPPLAWPRSVPSDPGGDLPGAISAAPAAVGACMRTGRESPSHSYIIDGRSFSPHTGQRGDCAYRPSLCTTDSDRCGMPAAPSMATVRHSSRLAAGLTTEVARELCPVHVLLGLWRDEHVVPFSLDIVGRE
jgi:hypothetical protein